MEASRLAVVATTLAVVTAVLSLDPLLHVFKALGGGPGGEAREEIGSVEVIPLVGAVIGPESLAFDADGEGPYTGVSDGRILKWQGRRRGWREFAVSPPHLTNDECRGSRDLRKEHVCGRPLGLRFNEKTGDLYIADAYLGLLTVAADDNLTRVVASHARGVPFRFTNGLDIDQETGIVYFTDSSTSFQRREFIAATISADGTGRVMKYDPRDGEVEVLLDGLSFPNGVALSHDGSFLLIAETASCRILRYWLRTPRSGDSEVLTRLGGFPDNIKRSPRGGYWVALHSKRGKLMEWILPLPWLGEMLRKVPFDAGRLILQLLRWTARASAVRLGEEGEVLEVLEGVGGTSLRFVSEVEEKDGRLWIGSVQMPHVCVYEL